jgi:hypothetical protein
MGVGVWFRHVWDFWTFGFGFGPLGVWVRLGLILSDFVTDLQLSSVWLLEPLPAAAAINQFVPSFSFFHRVIITLSSARRSRPAPPQADCHRYTVTVTVTVTRLRAREHEAET